MIWARRICTIPIGILLWVFLLAAVVLMEINGSFLNTTFYRDTLRDADIYSFALNDLARTALDEARQMDLTDNDGGMGNNPLVTSGLTTDDLVLSLNRALPPEWVQEVAEQILDQPGKYLTGQRDDFTVTIEGSDRVVAVVDEFKTLTRKADAYNLLFEQVVVPRIGEAMARDLPYGIEVEPERLEESVRRVVPPEWVQANVESALDSVTPYIVGDADSFEVRVELADRVNIASDEIKAILRESDAYDLVYDEVVEPIIDENLGMAARLDFDISISRTEITEALRVVAPPEWVQEQAELIIDATGRYITGETDTLRISIDLRDNKANARSSLVQMARQRFDAVVDDLPPCTMDQLKDLARSGTKSLPECMPGAGTAYGDQIKSAVSRTLDTLERQVDGSVDQEVLGQIPDTLVFTDRTLRDQLAASGASENIDMLDQVRDVIGGGWSYTESDLRADLLEYDSQDSVDLLDDVRSFLKEGWVFTERDLQAMVTEDEPEAFADLEEARTWLKRVRIWTFLMILPVVILLIIIAFLGGRTWPGRVAWSAGYLAISAASIWAVFGPVYATVSDERLEAARQEAITSIQPTDNFAETQTLLMNKVFDTAAAVSDGFAGGVAGKAIVVLIVGVVALSGAVFWPRLVLVAQQSGILDRQD